MSDTILEIKNLEKKFIINKNEIKVLENINIDIKIVKTKADKYR